MRYQEIMNTSNRKPNENLADQGSKFYNKIFKSCFNDNDIDTYSTHKERKSVVAERFIRSLNIRFIGI